MSFDRMDLGRLPELMTLVAGAAGGITIRPLTEEGGTFGGGLAIYVTGWEITYETANGAFTTSGTTVSEAVDAALANPAAW